MRNEILNLISRIQPFDELEAEHIRDTLNWIKSGAEIFRRKKPDDPPRHLNTYFFIWDPAVQKALFGDHIKSGLWLPGGGHVEPEEHPKATIEREMKEEFDLKADFLFDEPAFLAIAPTVGPTAGHVDVGLWYLLKGNSHDIPAFDSAEFLDVKWVSRGEITFLPTDRNMERFLAKILPIRQTHALATLMV